MLKIVLEHQEYWKLRDQLRGTHCNLAADGDGWDRVVTVAAGMVRFCIYVKLANRISL